jgi:uncharacterized protein YbjT (DUF2867 family)
MSQKIAVLGATGRIGTHIADVLRERGVEAVPMSRSTGVDVITGEGLDLAGIDIVIDATTGPSPDEAEATQFFTTSARNLQAAASKAGVQWIVAISIVGIDAFTGGYNAAKKAQEAALREGPVPVRIVRVTQFHEFVDALMQWGRQGDTIYVWGMRTQLVAARAAAEVVVDVALADDAPALTNVGGPRPEELLEVARLKAAHDGENVSVEEAPAPADAELYKQGAALPGEGALLVGPTYEEWLASRTFAPPA